MTRLVFKILRGDEWDLFQSEGVFHGAPIDLQDGYIHFSAAHQVRETAAKHFGGITGLMLVACDTNSLDGQLKWEVSRGGDKFPHLYGELRMTDVVWTKPLPLENGVHVFPHEVVT
ncbi:MAG: DUF952 domain-containing protein [Pseudomonadota bacterium]